MFSKHIRNKYKVIIIIMLLLYFQVCTFQYLNVILDITVIYSLKFLIASVKSVTLTVVLLSSSYTPYTTSYPVMTPFGSSGSLHIITAEVFDVML